MDKHAAMRAEGWLFSTTDNEFIGIIVLLMYVYLNVCLYVCMYSCG